MKKLAKLLISFGAGYAVGNMVKNIRKKEFKNVKPLKIDAGYISTGNLEKVFDDIKLDIKADSIVSTTSEINEIRKEIGELKRVMNTHERYIRELDSHISEVVGRIQ